MLVDTNVLSTDHFRLFWLYHRIIDWSFLVILVNQRDLLEKNFYDKFFVLL